MKTLSLALTSIVSAALLHTGSAAAQTIDWIGDFGGNLVSSPPSGWSVLPPNDPGGSPLFYTSTSGASPGGGQVIEALISSDFLFESMPHGVHLAIGGNYSPVYSGGFYPPSYYYTWGIEGNIASAFIAGDFGRGCSAGQGALEAIYQVPRITWTFHWGVTGGGGLSENDVDATTCAHLPVQYVDGVEQARVRLTSYYDGTVTLEFLSPFGTPLPDGPSPVTRSWASWFNDRAGAVPQNTGVALALIGNVPPGSWVKVDVVQVTSF